MARIQLHAHNKVFVRQTYRGLVVMVRISPSLVLTHEAQFALSEEKHAQRLAHRVRAAGEIQLNHWREPRSN